MINFLAGQHISEGGRETIEGSRTMRNRPYPVLKRAGRDGVGRGGVGWGGAGAGVGVGWRFLWRGRGLLRKPSPAPSLSCESRLLWDLQCAVRCHRCLFSTVVCANFERTLSAVSNLTSRAAGEQEAHPAGRMIGIGPLLAREPSESPDPGVGQLNSFLGLVF